MLTERIFLNPDDERVYIDAYVSDTDKNRDAMLVIPGGGYAGVCSDREGGPIAEAFFDKGYNAFVLNYRVGRETDRFPCQLLDAAGAMLYIRENADRLGVNRDRVFAVGFSAGGHLAGSLATMFAYDEVKAAFGDKYRLVRPEGVVLAYPVTTLLENTHMASFKNLLGKDSFSEADKKKFSLDAALTKDSSPAFVWHTVEDQIVPVEGSIAFAAALKKNVIPFRMSIFPYGPHGVALANAVTEFGNPAFVQPMAECWVSEADEWMKTLSSY
jgi:acetyl esterase/lipase